MSSGTRKSRVMRGSKRSARESNGARASGSRREQEAATGAGNKVGKWDSESAGSVAEVWISGRGGYVLHSSSRASSLASGATSLRRCHCRCRRHCRRRARCGVSRPCVSWRCGCYALSEARANASPPASPCPLYLHCVARWVFRYWYPCHAVLATLQMCQVKVLL